MCILWHRSATYTVSCRSVLASPCVCGALPLYMWHLDANLLLTSRHYLFFLNLLLVPPLPLPPLCSGLVSGQLQTWELQDPPCGCTAGAEGEGGGASALATGEYQVGAHTPELVSLVERAMQDAASSGEDRLGTGEGGERECVLCAFYASMDRAGDA